MKKHFVEIDGCWVNPWQVCYLRNYWEKDEVKGTLIGFHGGVVAEGYTMQTNEVIVNMRPSVVAEKLEEAMQNEVFVTEGGGAE